LVTQSGLEALTNAVRESRNAYDAAQRIWDAAERRRAAAATSWDMRYFANSSQDGSARSAAGGFQRGRFGHRVTFRRDDGTAPFPAKLQVPLLRRRQLPNKLRKVVPVFVVARPAAFRGEIVLVPPLQLGGWRQWRLACFLAATISTATTDCWPFRNVSRERDRVEP
jgi:hypothetical protein